MKGTWTVIGASVVGFVGVTLGYSAKSSPPKHTVANLGGVTTTTAGSSTSTTGANATAQSTTTTAPPTGVRSAVGATENYGYGDLAVTVTANGSTITDIKLTTIQTLEAYSAQLAQQVVPILRGEALKAQGPKITAISGATYTSYAYAYSLQSALNKLGLK